MPFDPSPTGRPQRVIATIYIYIHICTAVLWFEIIYILMYMYVYIVSTFKLYTHTIYMTRPHGNGLKVYSSSSGKTLQWTRICFGGCEGIAVDKYIYIYVYAFILFCVCMLGTRWPKSRLWIVNSALITYENIVDFRAYT